MKILMIVAVILLCSPSRDEGEEAKELPPLPVAPTPTRRPYMDLPVPPPPTDWAVPIPSGPNAVARTAPRAQEGRVVIAEAFVLKNKEGQVRAVLDLGEDGDAQLRFFDGDGARRVLLTESWLGFFDEKGKVSASLDATALSFRDSPKKVNTRISASGLSVYGDDDIQIFLQYDSKKGKPLMMVGNQTGSGYVALGILPNYDKPALVISATATPKLAMLTSSVLSLYANVSDESGLVVSTTRHQGGSELTASGLTLRDKTASVRSGLTLAEDGSSGLAFMDENGKGRLLLGRSTGHAVTGLFLFGEDGHEAGKLQVSKEGGSLVFLDETRKSGIVLGMNEQQGPGLVFTDRYARMRVLISIDEGVPMFFLYDENGNPKGTAYPLTR